MGVPFGFSIADIAKAIKLSKEIYDRCYNEDQGASQSMHHLENPYRRVVDLLLLSFSAS